MSEEEKKVNTQEEKAEETVEELNLEKPTETEGERLTREATEALKAANEAKSKAEAAEAKLATCMAQYVRLQADFDNYRRRTRESEAKAADTHTAKTLEAFLPVLDNFELAMKHMKKDPQGAAYVEGYELLQKQFVKILENFGVKEIEAEGAVFDPHFHEAVMMVPAEDKDDETIAAVFQKGYMYKDAVLRPAKVQVVHNG